MSGELPHSIDELLSEFDDLQSWEERYEYLIELGRALPPFPDQHRTKDNQVHGCMSTVWLVAHANGAGVQPRVLHIDADSDSLIVRGLIAVLLVAFDGRPIEEVATCDVEPLFARLGLDQHLSSQRRNGLYAMVQRLRGLAIAELTQS